MSFVDDRLRAADPVAGRPYGHPSLDTVIARITSPPSSVLENQWRSFKLRMASAVAAASLLTVGGIALLQGSVSSLPLLSLATTVSASQYQTFAATATGTMTIDERFQFEASPDLNGESQRSPAYALTTPGDAKSELNRLAGIFGVSGPATSSGQGNWSMTGSDQSTLWYQSNGGVGAWSFDALGGAPSTSVTSGVSTSPLPSDATIATEVQHFVGELGYGYSIANPSFSTQSITTTLNSGVETTVNEAVVGYDVVVRGVPTDQSVTFAFDQSNDLVSASGPAFYVGSSTDYPLQSPLEAVSTLNEQQAERFAERGAVTATGTGSSTDGGSHGTVSSSLTTTAPPTVEVTIDSTSIQLATFQLDDGSFWLVPEYSLAGESTNPDGTTSPGKWQVVAVDPTYVHLGSGLADHVIDY